MRIRVPGDKSLTQRALILASLAQGESRLTGLLHGGDAESTAGALRALGVSIPSIPGAGGEVRIVGKGLSGLQSPGGPLDLGNSGTGTRLLLGVLAGSSVEATVTGDESLRGRPMARVTQPLSAMGAVFSFMEQDGRLPIRVRGRRPLAAIDWSSPVASAQVKSAILLAGVVGEAFALVTEPRRSRDHTERLLNHVGASVVSHAGQGGWRVELRDPPESIGPLDFHIPGDISSASFLLALGAMGATSDGVMTVEGVGLNPTRTAFLNVLERMGAELEIERTTDDAAPEPMGDVTVRSRGLRGTEIGADEIPALIDELPLVAVLGARAEGVTRITGAEELRAKESDRIRALVDNFRTLGVEVEEQADGLVVQGSERPLRGFVKAFGDHRIAMCFGVLNQVRSCEIEIDDPFAADVSFPGFWKVLETVGRA